ncbi:MAG: hypothetical protein WD381_01695 [Balneolaceae bacterium]
MITLHRKKEDSKSDELEEKLKEMVLAYKTSLHHSAESKYPLPYIEDGESIFTKDEEIEAWVLELETELKWQRSLSGDGCFIHPNSGKIC